MKAFGNLLMTISLIAGVLAAATSYFTPLDGIDPEKGLELAAVAGHFNPESTPELAERVGALHGRIDEDRRAREPAPLLDPVPPVVLSEEERFVPDVAAAPTGEQELATREARVALGRVGDPIDADLQALMADAGDGAPKVKVKRFNIGRWQHWWVYLIACGGLLSGAALVRVANKAAIERARGAGETGEQDDSPVASARDPGALISATQKAITELRKTLELIPTREGRLAEILNRLGALQRGELMDFVASKEKLVARFGLGGFAGLMDRFSAAERQINRAWSAAADGVEIEAVSCLGTADEMLEMTAAKLRELES